MIFFGVHHVMNYLKPKWREAKKNCITFLIGANIHLVIFIILQYFATSTKNKLFELFYKFYVVFVIIDAIAMAILYKSYWGRTILNEMGPEDDWKYDEKTHRYHRNKSRNLSVPEKSLISQEDEDQKDISVMNDLIEQDIFSGEPEISSEIAELDC